MTFATGLGTTRTHGRKRCLRSGVGCRWVDDGSDGSDGVGGESAFGRVAPDQLFARCDVDAEEFVGSDVGLDPLDLGAELSESGARGLRRGGELLGGELANVGDVAFDEKFRHFHSFAVRVWGPISLLFELTIDSLIPVLDMSGSCQEIVRL
jgi:hypothetical protein